MNFGGHKVNEGDYVSMEIVSTDEPSIYLGKAELEYPDIEKNGVKDLLEKAKQFAMGIKILANADTPDESRQAKLLGADGIGLCRTEHMFHRHKRIYTFRDLLITRNAERKKDILNEIKAFLKSILYLGIIGNGLSQWYYWRTLSKSMISYRKSFPDAVALIVYGHHFRKVAKKICRRYARKIPTPTILYY